MKKLSLKNINLSEIEQLSREQLKSVMGGFGFGNTETTERCPGVGDGFEGCSGSEDLYYCGSCCEPVCVDSGTGAPEGNCRQQC